MDKEILEMVDETILEVKRFININTPPKEMTPLQKMKSKRRTLMEWWLKDQGVPQHAAYIDNPSPELAKKAGIAVHKRDVPRAGLQIR